MPSADGSALAFFFPDHISAAGITIQNSRQDEQEIRQPVHVLARRIVDRLALADTDDDAFGTAAHSTANIGDGGRA